MFQNINNMRTNFSESDLILLSYGINVTMPWIWSFFLPPPPLHGLTYPTHGSSTGECCSSSTVERSATTSSFFSEHNSLTEDPWKVGCSKVKTIFCGTNKLNLLFAIFVAITSFRIHRSLWNFPLSKEFAVVELQRKEDEQISPVEDQWVAEVRRWIGRGGEGRRRRIVPEKS